MNQEQLIELLSEIGFLPGHAQYVKVRGHTDAYRTVVGPPGDTVTYSHIYRGTITNVSLSFGDWKVTMVSGPAYCRLEDEATGLIATTPPDILYKVLADMDFKTNANY